jgi:phospholipid transport system transporter-binding protein
MMVDDGARLIVSGPLTLATVNALVEGGTSRVAAEDRVVDLAGVTQVDSAALALLLSWLRAAHGAGRRLSFEHAPTALASLAALYDVDTILSLA